MNHRNDVVAILAAAYKLSRNQARGIEDGVYRDTAQATGNANQDSMGPVRTALDAISEGIGVSLGTAGRRWTC
jgi:hypothetical protein